MQSNVRSIRYLRQKSEARDSGVVAMRDANGDSSGRSASATVEDDPRKTQ